MIFEFLTACGKSPSLISGARSPCRGGGRKRRNAC
jgi:hypothetical protein